MKARTIVLIVVGALLAAFLIGMLLPAAAFTCLWGPIACASYSATVEEMAKVPEPDVPVITRAEFPFTLVYELDGEEIVVNDTFICEYTGSRWLDSTKEKIRNWELTYSDGSDELVLYREDAEDGYVSFMFGDGYLAEYLMGDTEHCYYDENYCDKYNADISEQWFPKETYTKTDTFRASTGYSSISGEELYEQYGVRLISFELHAEPIVNTFIPEEEAAP